MPQDFYRIAESKALCYVSRQVEFEVEDAAAMANIGSRYVLARTS